MRNSQPSSGKSLKNGIPDSDVPVTENEIEQYYRDHPEEFEVPARASFRYAFLDKTPTAADSIPAP